MSLTVWIPEFVDDETPVGIVDGTNPTFTLQLAPAALKLRRNGLRQEPGIDYTMTGPREITFAPASIPQPGDVLRADYRH